MKKIIITTFNEAHNYGAILQEYALYNLLSNKLENSTEVLNYKDHNISKFYKISILGFGSIKNRLKIIIKNIFFYNKIKKRYNAFVEFQKEKVKLTKKEYIDINEIRNDKIDADVFITGSDQVWNPEITNGLSEVYTLDFGNENSKRISYAASIGNEKNIPKYKEDYQKKLSNIDRISIREESSKKELEKILGDKKIDVVLDPTLLLSKNEWEEEIKKIKKEKQKYILAYVVEQNKEYIKIVNDLSEKTNLKIIHFGLKNPGYKDIFRSAYTEGPLEFINLIKNAEYVVATSFHATVFSIIFNKKFWIVPHKTTGSRVTDLLKKFGISNRAVNTFDEFKNKDYNEAIDYEKVNKILEKERNKSIDWLKDAIEK